MVAIRWKISKRSVDELEPPSKGWFVRRDADIKGFGVEVRSSGLKIYVYLYRPAPGGRGINQKRLVLGYHGEITPDQARQKALDARAAIRQGADPAGEKARQRAALSVDGLVGAFLGGHAAKLKPKSLIAYEGGLAKLRSAHGALIAEALARAHVAALHAGMCETPYAGNRMLAATSAMFAWAERGGLLPEGHSNPARGLRRFREQGRERFLSTGEFARLADALHEGETVGLPFVVDDGPNAKHAPKAENRLTKLDPFAAAAIRLLILTGARLREILHAKWSELDLERGVLFLSDSKSGRRPIYLGAAAQAVIAALPRLQGNPHIIPGSIEGKPRDGLRRPWAAVTRAAGLEGLRIHDLRHSFASVAAASGMGLPIVGKLLGHTTQATTARYAHLASEPMLLAAERIGATIDGAMNRTSAEVVKLRGK